MLLFTEQDMRVEFKETGGSELKWCVFTKGLRGSIAKIIVSIPKQNKTTAHITSVYVSPEFRGKRLGEKLVALAQNSLRENGFSYVTLEAEENMSQQFGRLVALYQRCGFEIHPPGLTKFAIEYNGDEAYRKVPMRCDLLAMLPAEQTTTTTTSRLCDVLEFCIEMRRECLRLVPGGEQEAMSIPKALDWIQQNCALDLDSHRLADAIRERGHPDWMELAAYLIHLGRIQTKYTQWHAPFMFATASAGKRHASSPPPPPHDEEEEPSSTVKYGPLPDDFSTSELKILDTDHYYAQQGLDECTLTWNDCEYAFCVLSQAQLRGESSAPAEMAQILRYYKLDCWLDSDEYESLQSETDCELKAMTLAFRECVREARAKTGQSRAREEDAHNRRLQELLEKYLFDVRVM